MEGWAFLAGLAVGVIASLWVAESGIVNWVMKKLGR